MAGARTTGVTLQTLDRKEFDNGVILDQTPANGLRIPFGSKCTYNQLLAFVTPVAAAMLVKGLQDRVFVEPHLDVGWLKKNPKNLIHARKITPADRRVNWREHSGTTIERHFRALGRMWSLVVDDKKQRKRVVFADMELVPKPQLIVDWAKRFADKQYGPMKPTNEDKENIHFAVIDDNGYRKPRYYVVDGSAVIFACQHDGIRVNQITVEGKGKQDAATAMKNFKDWGTWKLRAVDRHINCLHKDENLGAVTWKSIPSPGKECDSEEAKKTNSPDEAYDQATDPSDAAIDPSISDKVLDQKSQAKSDGS
jgi:methionyl-tRNA formyltransferase